MDIFDIQTPDHDHMGFCLQEIQLYLPNCRITSIFLFRYIIQKDVICIMILYLIRRYRVIISIIIFLANAWTGCCC